MTITNFGLACALSLAIAGPAGAVAAPRDASDGTRHRASRAELARRHKAAHTSPIATRRHVRSKVLYRSGEHRVAQISPAILRRADPHIDDAARHSCGTVKAGRDCDHATLRHARLPESLLQAPSPATEQSLKQLGIPIVRDVYPIVILRAGATDREDNLASERH